MNAFYLETLQQLLARGVLSKEDRILVTCGAGEDREVFQAAGFKNVVISNLFHAEEKDYRPFQWSYQDAENLSFGDGEFDFCVVHAGLHHCGSPHRALTEMYRVARKGLLAHEPIDTLIVRLSQKTGIADEYEPAAVAGHEYRGGGWRNSIIPNYVHRWTRAEVERAIKSYAPYGRPQFIYFHKWGVDHIGTKLRGRGRIPGLFGAALQAFVKVVLKPFFGRWGNLFAFVALKPRLPQDLQPWLELKNGEIRLNEEWFREHRMPKPELAKLAKFPFARPGCSTEASVAEETLRR